MEATLADELEPSEKPNETIAKSDVMTKYKYAGRAVDEVMNIVAAACVPGERTNRLCDLGDEELLRRVRGMFVKAKDADGRRILRGLSFPTNVSVNHTLCHHAPLTDGDAVVLRGGDTVKIHMGCHIDGYPVSAARTLFVPLDTTTTNNNDNNMENMENNNTMENNSAVAPNSLTPGASNAVEAARVALLGLIHSLRPGALNADLTDFVHRVGNHMTVQALEGVLSNRSKRWVPDGVECIINRRVTSEDPHQDVAECCVAANQVWTLDVAFTDHSLYKVVPADEPTTLFRRTEVDFASDARVRSVHATLQDITDRHQCFPFSLKHTENVNKARMAVAMLRKQNVMDPVPVLRIKGERHIAARFSATVAVSERRVTVLCGLPPVEPLVVPDAVRPTALAEDILSVIMAPLEFENGTQTRNKKRRVEKTDDGAAAATATATSVAASKNDDNENEEQ